MKKEFVSYNISKRLKDMGFDEPCFGFYLYPDSDLTLVWRETITDTPVTSNSQFLIASSAPLWQQVTRWFRDVHKINITVDFFPNVKKWSSFSYSQNLNGKEYVKERSMKKFMEMTKYDTYEEALESEIINIVNHWKIDEKETKS
jgi:hypothetical protein